jgi:hypothetical protein
VSPSSPPRTPGSDPSVENPAAFRQEFMAASDEGV